MASRAFTGQAVAAAARAGIGQFIDLGAGYPAAPAVHGLARAVNPAARVAYVSADEDAAHLTAWRYLDEEHLTGISALWADLRDVDGVLKAADVIRAGEPVCVTAGYMRELAPGSVLVATNWRNESPAQWARVAETWTARTGTAVWNFTPGEFAGLFGSLEMVAGSGPAAWPHGAAHVLAGAGGKA